MDIISMAYAKKLVNGLQSGLDTASVDNDTCSITFHWKNGTSSTMTFPKPLDGANGVGISDVKLKEVTVGSGKETHLICTLDDGTEIDAGNIPEGTTDYADLTNKPSINSIELSGNKTLADLGITNYDDTQVKADIADLKSDKQDKTDNLLKTTDKTVAGAINEINGNLLGNVTFSADFKNIIINRKSGLNPYTIPIASIIHNAKIAELNDVDSTNIGDGKTLVYDGATQKHKYVDSTGTDELVKMDSTTDAKHLSELIDKSTIINDNGVLKVKKLDGQEVTIAEINYLKGLTMNVMDLVNVFANGGVKVLHTPVNTYADLSTLDRSTFIDGISYIVYVLADETHSGAKTTYLCDKTSETFFGSADSQRNFITNPIDLANEITGKLGTSNIDVDSLWSLLTINDTYKTLTTKNEPFGTHGAKALYDELVTGISKKANATDLTSHTGDTDIHITTSERTKWNEVDNKVNKTDITTTFDDLSTDNQVPSAKSIYYNCIEGIQIYQTTMDTYGTEILKYPLGIWRINSDDLASKFTDLPVKTSGRIEITSIDSNTHKNPLTSSWSYRVYNFETYTLGNYTRKITSANIAGVFDCDTGWQKVCTTSVADKSFTSISASNITNATITTGGDLSYSIKNGICYVKMNGLVFSGKGDVTVPTGTFPLLDNSISNGHFPVVTNNNNCYLAILSTSGSLTVKCGTGTGTIYTTISYPVAEQ